MVFINTLCALIASVTYACHAQKLSEHAFPEDFRFGVATSSYQIEGAWNLSGKGEHIWDRFSHQYPERIIDGSNGDIACDSYHKYREDVAMCRHLGVDFYRFSIAWSRLLPTGLINKINQDGINYYNNLINELLANKIEPMITLYHWDLPQPLQDLGGWSNPLIVNYYLDYVDLAFREFGDRVKLWLTFNEPSIHCGLGYGKTDFAPAINMSGIADYQCAYSMLNAHALAYHMYDEKYRPQQKGKIGISLEMAHWQVPKSDSPEDIEAAKRSLQFSFGFYANPIFGTGDFPEVVKRYVAERSKREGFAKSRLPQFSPEEIARLHGSSDFLGLNMYSAIEVAHKSYDNYETINTLYDMECEKSWNEQWENSTLFWLKVVPWALLDTLRWIQQEYKNPNIMITENGYADFGGVDDYNRVRYLQLYLSSVLEAIHTYKVNVTSYTAWSLMDNYEWPAGYTQKFGIYDVDFNDPDRPRRIKLSGQEFKRIIESRVLPTHAIAAMPLQDKTNEAVSFVNVPYLYLILIINVFQMIFL